MSDPTCESCGLEIRGAIERTRGGQEYHGRCLPLTLARKTKLARFSVDKLTARILDRIRRKP